MLIRLGFYVNWVNLFWKQSALLLRRILKVFCADIDAWGSLCIT